MQNTLNEAADQSSEHTLGGFLRVLEISAAAAAQHPDAFDRLRHGSLQAILVHAVLEPRVLERVVDRLETHDPPFLQTWFPEKFRAWFFGRNLNLADPALEGYFDEAELFNDQLGSLVEEGGTLAERLAQVLSALDGGRPFVAAPGRRPAERYMFTTLRAHPEGGYIPPHFDNELALVDSYAHLRSIAQPHITSFVLTFALPESGGTLEVYDCRCEPEHARFLRANPQSRPSTDGLRSAEFRVPAGSLIVLDSGRYLHRVAPVEGPRTRWTACSFMALSRAGDAMYCWG
jgi:hypothetical protein